MEFGFWILEFCLLPRAKLPKISYHKEVTKSAYIIRLLDVPQSSPELVGEKAWQLGQLAQQGFPQPQTFVLPTSTLNTIADHNQVRSKIKDILSVTDWTDRTSLQQSIQQLKQVIKSQHIPSDIAHQLLEAYYQVTQNKPVIVRYSNLPQSSFRSNYASRPVQGDANLVESILTSWGEQYQPHSLSQFAQSLDQTGNISNPFFVQTHFPQDSIEISLSKNPQTNSKQHILIRSHPQASQTHELQYDIQNKQLQPTTDQVRAKLSQNVIEQIAKYTQQAKRQQLNHVTLEWAIDHHQPLLLNISAMADRTNVPVTPQSTITGTTLVTGESQGIGFRFDQKSLLHSPPPLHPGILVCQQLTREHLALLPKIKGIITATQPTQLILSILHQYHLPTLLISTNSLSSLVGKSLAIDGSNQRVQIHQPLTARITNHLKKQQLPNQVFAIGGNGATLHLTTQQNSDGLYFDSWKVYQQLNLHPLWAAEHPEDHQIWEAITRFFDAYTQHQHHQILYRSLAATSFQLQNLKHASEFPQSEVNPNLGNRGAIFYLAHPQLLQLELNMIVKLQQQYNLPISWVSTFNRTPSELQALTHLVNDFNTKHSTQIPIWMEISTPAEALQLNQYNLSELGGLIFNTDQLHSLSYAIDPKQSALAQLYPVDGAFSALLVKNSVELVSQMSQLPTLVLMKAMNQIPIQQLSSLVTGFITRPQHVDPIKYLLSKK